MWKYLLAAVLLLATPAHAINFCTTPEFSWNASVSDEEFTILKKEHKCISTRVEYSLNRVVDRGYIDDKPIFIVELQVSYQGQWWDLYTAFDNDPWYQPLTNVQWDGSPYKGWADKQQVMPAARARFNCAPVAPNTSCSCCDGAEIVKTKFRVAGDFNDAWDWLNPKTKQWERVPDDIIHWGEPTPDKQAVMFEYPIGSGTPRCFFPPQAEGG